MFNPSPLITNEPGSSAAVLHTRLATLVNVFLPEFELQPEPRVKADCVGFGVAFSSSYALQKLLYLNEPHQSLSLMVWRYLVLLLAVYSLEPV